jgi:hypothetical protein
VNVANASNHSEGGDRQLAHLSLSLRSNPLALSPDEISAAMNNSTPSLIISRINFKVALGVRCLQIRENWILSSQSAAVKLLLIKSTNFTVCN